MDLSSIPTKQIQDQIEEFKIKFQNDMLLGKLSQRCKIAIEKWCDAPDEYQKLDCNKLIDALKAKDHKLYMTINDYNYTWLKKWVQPIVGEV